MQLILLLVLVALLGLLHRYLWVRLVRDTTAGGRARRLGAVLAAVLAVLPPATLVGTRVLPREVARWLAWPGYLWLGLFFYLLVGLAVLEPVRLVVLAVLRRTPALPPAPPIDPPPPAAATHPASTAAATHPASATAAATALGTAAGAAAAPAAVTSPLMSRRTLLARSTAAVVGATALGATGYGAREALGPPGVTAVTVPLRRLPAALDGLRIAVVADLHLGPVLGRRHTERIVRLVNEQRADLVAVVGDLVDGTVGELGEAAAPLRDLTSVHGSYFVTGNHEYYSGAQPWLRELDRLGVHPLVNERTEISAGGAVLDLAGVNDPAGARSREPGDTGPDYDRALAGRDTRRPVVLLAHQPVQVRETQRRGVDLQLSGHTHGGQMFPFHAMVRLQQPVLAGLHRFGDTQLFVTRGAGFWGPPVRLGAPPEIAVLRLVREPA